MQMLPDLKGVSGDGITDLRRGIDGLATIAPFSLSLIS